MSIFKARRLPQSPQQLSSFADLNEHIQNNTNPHPQYLKVSDYTGNNGSVDLSGYVRKSTYDPFVTGINQWKDNHCSTATGANPHPQYLFKSDYLSHIDSDNNPDPHPQYLLRSDYSPNTGGGTVDIPSDVLRMSDLIGKSGNTAPTNTDTNKPLSGWYGYYLKGLFLEHTQPFSQMAELGEITCHLDTNGGELFARRIHSHKPIDIGAADREHLHDAQYLKISDITSSRTIAAYAWKNGSEIIYTEGMPQFSGSPFYSNSSLNGSSGIISNFNSSAGTVTCNGTTYSRYTTGDKILDMSALDTRFARKSHSHSISDVDNLQGALDDKSPDGHHHSVADIDDFSSCCVTSINGKTGAVTIDLASGTMSSVTGVNGIKLGSTEATTLTGVVTITPSSIGAQVAGSYALSNHDHSNEVLRPNRLEMRASSISSNNGGYIDFHYNQINGDADSDYTARIIENNQGEINICTNTAGGQLPAKLKVNNIEVSTVGHPHELNDITNLSNLRITCSQITDFSDHHSFITTYQAKERGIYPCSYQMGHNSEFQGAEVFDFDKLKDQGIFYIKYESNNQNAPYSGFEGFVTVYVHETGDTTNRKNIIQKATSPTSGTTYTRYGYITGTDQYVYHFDSPWKVTETESIIGSYSTNSTASYTANRELARTHIINLNANCTLTISNLRLGETLDLQVQTNDGKTLTFNSVVILTSEDSGKFVCKFSNKTGTPQLDLVHAILA